MFSKFIHGFREGRREVLEGAAVARKLRHAMKTGSVLYADGGKLLHEIRTGRGLTSTAIQAAEWLVNLVRRTLSPGERARLESGRSPRLNPFEAWQQSQLNF